jgi:hypothetical protein
MAPIITTLLAVLHTAVFPAMAAPPADWPPSVEAFCEATWPDQEASTRSDAEMCARYWLKRYVYGNGRPEAIGFSTNVPEYWLEADHYNGLQVETQVTAERFQQMIRHIQAATPEAPLARQIAERAQAYFAGAIVGRFTLRGLSSSPVNSIAPQLAKVLSGKRLQPADLACFTPVTLWKLRNGVYARHGAPLHDPDLEAFFYGRRTALLKRPLHTSLLPRRVRADYKDDVLTEIDQYNIGLIEQVRVLDKQTRCGDVEAWGIAALY